MGPIFYHIFSIINISCMQLKFYHGHHSQKFRLQNGSFPYDIGVLFLVDILYTSLDSTKFYLMHFSLFSTFSI